VALNTGYVLQVKHTVLNYIGTFIDLVHGNKSWIVFRRSFNVRALLSKLFALCQ